MAAPEGNTNRQKFKTSKARKEVFERLKAHLSQCFTMDCFPELSRNTILEYCKKFPSDFPIEEVHQSLRVAQKKDESLGIAATSGRPMENFNPQFFSEKIYAMKMQNRWGRGYPREGHKTDLEVLESAEKEQTETLKMEFYVLPKQEPGGTDGDKD